MKYRVGDLVTIFDHQTCANIVCEIIAIAEQQYLVRGEDSRYFWRSEQEIFRA